MHTELAVDGVVVHVVQYAGDLHPGRVDESSEVVVGGHCQLSGEQLVDDAHGAT